jgi:hypothetical protein
VKCFTIRVNCLQEKITSWSNVSVCVNLGNTKIRINLIAFQLDFIDRVYMRFSHLFTLLSITQLMFFLTQSTHCEIDLSVCISDVITKHLCFFLRRREFHLSMNRVHTPKIWSWDRFNYVDAKTENLVESKVKRCEKRMYTRSIKSSWKAMRFIRILVFPKFTHTLTFDQLVIFSWRQFTLIVKHFTDLVTFLCRSQYTLTWHTFILLERQYFTLFFRMSRVQYIFGFYFLAITIWVQIFEPEARV